MCYIDTDAFIRLRQKLKRVSSRILPDADGAEDILQDSFVRLWRRQYRRCRCYQARPVGAAWIITILYLEGSATLDDLRSMFEKQ